MEIAFNSSILKRKASSTVTTSRSILGNFASSKMNGKEIEMEIDRNKDNGRCSVWPKPRK